MQHSRFLSTRSLLAACAFLTIAGAGLGLPQRGAAQDDMTRGPAAPGGAQGDATPGAGASTDGGSTGTGRRQRR